MNLLSSPTARHAIRVAGEFAPSIVTAPVLDRLLRPRRLPMRDWEKPALASARCISFRSGLSGLRWGDGTGPVVLALHGWEGRATHFRYVGEALQRAGFSLLALDGPAHGASPGHVAHPRLFAESLIDAANEIATERGRVHAVIGHSMGAGAVSYALSQGLAADRAVLIAGPSGYAPVVRGAAGMAGLGPRATHHLLRAVENRIGVAPEAIDVAQGMCDLDLPILIVHDRDDTFVEFAHAQRFMSYLADARLHATQGLGHWRVLTDPATVEAIAGFVAHPAAVRDRLALAA
ncbi:MAG: alpha/beta hydrolase [Panacagrimonas sp.]